MIKNILKFNAITIVSILFLLTNINAYVLAPTHAYYNLDNNLLDVTGNGNDLINFESIYTPNGKINGAYQFDGINDYMDSQIFYTLGTNNPISFGGWFKMPVLSGTTNTIMGHALSNSANPYTIFVNTLNHLIFNIGNQNGFVNNYDAGLITANTWYFVYTTYDGITKKDYLNGVLINSVNILWVGGGGMMNTGNFNLGRFGDLNANFFGGIIDEVSYYQSTLTDLDVATLYNNGIGLPFPSVSPLTIQINDPQSTPNYVYDTITMPLNVLTSEASTCTYTYSGVTNVLTSANDLTHTGTLNLLPATNLNQVYPITYDCQDLALTKTATANIIATQDALPPLVISNVQPTDLTLFTFDIENITIISLQTDFASSCTYTYNGTTTPMNTADTLTHTIPFFDFGIATTSIKQFPITYDCVAPSISGIAQQSVILQQNQVPVNLTINIPQDQQHFSPGTNQIQFYITTNYQATCDYAVLNNASNPIVNSFGTFQNTNSNIHTTNYTALFPSVRNYPLTFTCQATILGDTINRSIVFFLDEQLNLGLAETTKTLPSVGNDVGGFMSNLGSPLATFILNIAIIFAIVSVFISITLVFKRFVR